jgi:hypothetical protein
MAGQGELPQPQRLSMAQDALRVAQRDDERKVAISVLARVPNAEALVAVLPWLKSETLRDEAGVAAIAISEKLLPNDSATVAEAMEQILRTLKNQDLLRRATEIRTRAR